jgi:uncharacterized protein with GYD domain
LVISIIDDRRIQMAKYLIQASYTDKGLPGLLKEGGSKRREAVEQAVRAMGGTMEAFYYAFGKTDVFFIADYPDNVTAAATSLMGNAAGTSNVTITVLLTSEEVDQAAGLAREKMAAYRPPGQ